MNKYNIFKIWCIFKIILFFFDKYLKFHFLTFNPFISKWLILISISLLSFEFRILILSILNIYHSYNIYLKIIQFFNKIVFIILRKLKY